MAFRDVTDGSRNAGAIYGFDTFSISPILTLTYGGRYARYDYLETSSLVSPRVALSPSYRPITSASARWCRAAPSRPAPKSSCRGWTAASGCRRSGRSRRSSPAVRSKRSGPITWRSKSKRDIASATVSLRAFHQHVADQLVTLFASKFREPRRPSVTTSSENTGDADASGLSAGVRAAIASRFHGSVEYSLTRAHLNSPDVLGDMFVFAPTATRQEPQRIHDVATSIETEVPETSTRLVRPLSHQQRVRASRGRQRPADTRARLSFRRAGATVAALHGFQQREMGNAGRGEQFLP